MRDGRQRRGASFSAATYNIRQLNAKDTAEGTAGSGVSR